MKFSVYIFYYCIYFLIIIGYSSCSTPNRNSEVGEQSTTIIYADSIVKPLLDAQLEVFKIHYPKANVEIKYQFENSIVNQLFNSDIKIACMTRAFDSLEIKSLQLRKYKPKSVKIAHDAFVCITSSKTPRNSISVEDLKSSLSNIDRSQNFTIVTLTRNKSYQTLIKKVLNVNANDFKVYGIKDSLEVVKYLDQNKNSIGLFPLLWLDENYEWVKQNNCKILAIGQSDNNSMIPDQYHLSSGKYPLAVDIYFNIRSGFTGDGINFVNFCTNEIGQLVVLKAGLIPFNMPSREFYYSK